VEKRLDLWGMYIIQGKNSTREVPASGLTVELTVLSMSWTALSCVEVSVGKSYNMDIIVEAAAR
jgi:hypothetical protein